MKTEQTVPPPWLESAIQPRQVVVCRSMSVSHVYSPQESGPSGPLNFSHTLQSREKSFKLMTQQFRPLPLSTAPSGQRRHLPSASSRVPPANWHITQFSWSWRLLWLCRLGSAILWTNDPIAADSCCGAVLEAAALPLATAVPTRTRRRPSIVMGSEKAANNEHSSLAKK